MPKYVQDGYPHNVGLPLGCSKAVRNGGAIVCGHAQSDLNKATFLVSKDGHLKRPPGFRHGSTLRLLAFRFNRQMPGILRYNALDQPNRVAL